MQSLDKIIGVGPRLFYYATPNTFTPTLSRAVLWYRIAIMAFDEDNEKFDVDEVDPDEIVGASLKTQIFRGAITLLVIAGLLYISGVQQYFLYNKTPSSVIQPPVETLIGGDVIEVPLTVFIVAASEPYGSTRSGENVISLVRRASEIWDQAGIELEIKNVYTIQKSDAEMRDFYDALPLFLEDLDELDLESVNVFLVGTLKGINGIAFNARMVSVADYTTVYDFRALAHEVGHTLGLDHVSSFRGRLMYRGANGFKLSLDEVEQARHAAKRFTP